MMNSKPINLGNRIHLIDGYDLGMPARTGTYVIQEEQLTLIETGPSPSVPYILKGLNELGLNPHDVKYIIVTHIHLDHSGGVGLLLKDCPNATVIVHPKGERHLADPARLIQGAKAVYREKFDELFNPILPVPQEKLLAKNDGETLTIGANCTLTFIDTPGHANHHFSIYDPVSNGIFTGDTIGVRYEPLSNEDFMLYLPSTSPNQFNPDAMLNSMEKMKRLGVERIYFGHFSVSNDVEDVYEQISHWLPIFVNTGKQLLAEGKNDTDLAEELLSLVREHLRKLHVSDDHRVYNILKVDLEVCAMGIVDYLQKQQAKHN
ncbi:MBL fold metallo-hydrolase [Anaerobacillus sp. MEB173]|uniref:MBL fold metallo-hydrolase n=1 Tax=Anaerobacillus sp. MEB173 TaxID=3383345 RepID=UPI003F930261